MSTTRVIAAEADSVPVTSEGAYIPIGVTFPGRCIETELCWCEKVLTCHTSKRLKPLLGITSRFLRRHRSLGIVESLDQSHFCHQAKRFPSLDSSAQSTALPRQVSMPKGFLYLSVPEHCKFHAYMISHQDMQGALSL